MKTIVILVCIAMAACGGSLEVKKKTVKIIDDFSQQDSVFSNLKRVVGNIFPVDVLKDSLAFLVLPLEASCPSCREKTIDSIAKHKYHLPNNHFIIISASAGIKTMRSYFIERNTELPLIPGRVFLDSANLAYKFDLYTDNPAIYYLNDGRAYKKILALPNTIRGDLKEFFSGS